MVAGGAGGGGGVQSHSDGSADTESDYLNVELTAIAVHLK